MRRNRRKNSTAFYDVDIRVEHILLNLIPDTDKIAN